MSDLARVGGKNASLGEMFNALKPKEVWVPDGFATTAARRATTIRATRKALRCVRFLQNALLIAKAEAKTKTVAA